MGGKNSTSNRNKPAIRTQPTPSNYVPIMHDSSFNKPSLKRKATTRLGTRNGKGREEGENPKPDGVFSSYLDSAGARIRGASNGEARKPALRRDSFNHRVSGYIDRARQKFHDMPSNEYGNNNVDA